MANFIAKATANSHGQFRAKAEKSGMSTRAYAQKMSGASGTTGKQARLALTLMKLGGAGKGGSKGGGKNRAFRKAKGK